MMYMNTTIATGEKIPWYRGRLFWGIVLSPFFLFSLVIFFLEHFPPSSLYDFFFRLCISLGGFPIITIIAGFLGFSQLGKIIGMFLFVSLFVSLIVKTFKNIRVKIRYPIILILLIITGIIIGVPVG